MTRRVLDFGGIEYSEKIVRIKEWPVKNGGESSLLLFIINYMPIII